MEHKRGVLLCFIGGALMIFGSVIGSLGFIGKLLSLATNYVNPEIELVIQYILTIFGYIAAGGGISVIIGTLIAELSSNRIGRLVVGFGIGAGLISLIILLVMNFVSGGAIKDVPTVFLTAFNNGYGLAGVIIAIFGRMKLKE